MEPETTLTELVEAGVLRVDETRDEVVLADGFANAVEDVNPTDRVDGTERFPEDPELEQAVRDLAVSEPDFVRQFVALEEYLPGMDPVDLLKLVPVVDDLQFGPYPDSGSPDKFLPIRPKRIPVHVSLHSEAVVYVWKRDCEPCLTVKSDLSAMLTETDPGCPLFSVYGPDDSAFLREEYDVVGGPTLLFFVDGEVDARLQGAHLPRVVESELRVVEAL